MIRRIMQLFRERRDPSNGDESLDDVEEAIEAQRRESVKVAQKLRAVTADLREVRRIEILAKHR